MMNKILYFIALCAFCGLGSARAQSAPAASARVAGQIVAARVQGHVAVLSKAGLENRLLHDGDQVSEQATIVTSPEASVILVFSNGAAVIVAGDSRLDISEFEQDPFSGALKVSDMKQEPGTSLTRLNLTRGELTARVAHLNVDKGSEFTIQTPVGAAGIRGTFLRVIFRPGKDHKAQFSVQTFEGLVLFTGLTSGPVNIPAGRKFEATFEYNPKNVDNPAGWHAPSSLTLEGGLLSPAEVAKFQSELQAILAALADIVFPPYTGENEPPPPAPPLNPPTPGAGSGS
jgi:hypothetical protein